MAAVADAAETNPPTSTDTCVVGIKPQENYSIETAMFFEAIAKIACENEKSYWTALCAYLEGKCNRGKPFWRGLCRQLMESGYVVDAGTASDSQRRNSVNQIALPQPTDKGRQAVLTWQRASPWSSTSALSAPSPGPGGGISGDSQGSVSAMHVAIMLRPEGDMLVGYQRKEASAWADPVKRAKMLAAKRARSRPGSKKRNGKGRAKRKGKGQAQRGRGVDKGFGLKAAAGVRFGATCFKGPKTARG